MNNQEYCESSPCGCDNSPQRDNYSSLAAGSASALSQIKDFESSVVVAGHYCVAEHMQELSNWNEAESMSFKVGAEMVTRAWEMGQHSQLDDTSSHNTASSFRHGLPESRAHECERVHMRNDDSCKDSLC